MHQARVNQDPSMLRSTHLRVGRIVIFTVIIIGSLIGLAAYYVKSHGKPLGQDGGAEAAWAPSPRVPYEPEKPPSPVTQPPQEDPNAARWAALQKQLTDMNNELLALKNRPQEKAAAPPVVAAPKKKRHADMLFIQRELREKAKEPVDTYLLAPGATKIACQVETVINSDAGETFTAKTTTNVYDTATGKHLLIPQNSTILGKYEGQGLLYGNERLPTISLTLAFPNGQSVDLGHSPVTNQAGTSGLVSSVDQHWWRLFGAVFIGGALSGGATALQTSIAGAGPTGQIGAGIAQSGNQVIQRQQGRALDTRPTILVNAGELCAIILTKPLQLASMQQ